MLAEKADPVPLQHRAQYRKAGADAPVFTRLRLGLCEALRPLWQTLEKSSIWAAWRAVRVTLWSRLFRPICRPIGALEKVGIW